MCKKKQMTDRQHGNNKSITAESQPFLLPLQGLKTNWSAKLQISNGMMEGVVKGSSLIVRVCNTQHSSRIVPIVAKAFNTSDAAMFILGVQDTIRI